MPIGHPYIQKDNNGDKRTLINITTLSGRNTLVICGTCGHGPKHPSIEKMINCECCFSGHTHD